MEWTGWNAGLAVPRGGPCANGLDCFHCRGGTIGRLQGPHVGRDRGHASEVRRQQIGDGSHDHRRGLDLADSSLGIERECGAIGLAIVVAGTEQIHDPLVDHRSRYEVDVHPVGIAGAVPGEENHLLSHARPRPRQVGSRPAQCQRRQVICQEIPAFFVAQLDVAIHDGDRDPLWRSHTDGESAHTARVIAIDRCRVDPERRHELDYAVGEVEHAGVLIRRQGLRQAVARRVRRNDGKALAGERPHQRHVLVGRGGRLVQEQHRWATTGAPIVDLSPTRESHEMARDSRHAHFSAARKSMARCAVSFGLVIMQ